MLSKLLSYRHYKNKRLYDVDDYCSIQVRGKWVDAVIYYQKGIRNKLFVRSVKEFKDKFNIVKEVKLKVKKGKVKK
jgi:hypothetical protein